jgi:hypothetical protein
LFIPEPQKLKKQGTPEENKTVHNNESYMGMKRG